MLKKEDKIQNIAIFRALQLGDLLCAIPAVRAVRTSYPDSNITLIGLPWSHQLVKRYPHYFDRHISFPGHPALPEQQALVSAFPAFLMQMQHIGFDLLLQMHGSGQIVNPLLQLFQARHFAGYYVADGEPPSSHFIPYPEHLHEVHRHVLLMEHLGITPAGDYLEFPVTAADELELASLNLDLHEKGYICLHPGAREASRRWPPEKFAMLADHCVELGFRAVITGSSDETPLAEQVRSHMKYPALVLAGKTTLGSMAALVKYAKAVVSNCTGIAHLTVAVGTRSLVISLNPEPHRWSPLNASLHPAITYPDNTDFGNVANKLHTFLRADAVPLRDV